MVVAPCPNNKPKGCTAILIPTSALEIPPGSNYSAAYRGGAWGGRSPPLLGVTDVTVVRRVGSVFSHLSFP
eukprot:3431907-Prymnesium_polylepis.1